MWETSQYNPNTLPVDGGADVLRMGRDFDGDDGEELATLAQGLVQVCVATVFWAISWEVVKVRQWLKTSLCNSNQAQSLEVTAATDDLDLCGLQGFNQVQGLMGRPPR